MSITEKKRKKLTKWVLGARTKQNAILTDIMIQYFIIFCIAIFWDKICWQLQIKHDAGFGWIQILVCIGCIAQMYRYGLMIKE